MANYVKFRRGLISDFEKLPIENREPDTLYFIYDENGESAELYLGARKISGEGSISTESISELKDIVITKVQNNDLLVYDDISQTWINQSLDEIFADFMVTTEPTIVSVENIYNNKHQDLIDQEFSMTDPKVGDIVIIKDLISSNKWHHTGYVYNGENWSAMDGNYNAENIYFDEDFIFTENIGTITIPNSGSTAVTAAGKNLKEFLSTVFSQEKNPVITPPTATITLASDITSYEVGTEYTPSYSILFSPGSYSYGPESTGIEATYSVTDSFGQKILNTESGSFDSFIIKDSTNYLISASVSYGDGVIPKTNLQNDYLEGQIKSNTLPIITTNTIKGHRNIFYGALSNKEELTSDIIRALTGKATEKNFSINVPIGTQRILFAFPKETNQDEFNSAKNLNMAAAEVKSRFQKLIIPVAGENNYNPIDYNVFILDYANPTTIENIYEIIL